VSQSASLSHCSKPSRRIVRTRHRPVHSTSGVASSTQEACPPPHSLPGRWNPSARACPVRSDYNDAAVWGSTLWPSSSRLCQRRSDCSARRSRRSRRNQAESNCRWCFRGCSRLLQNSRNVPVAETETRRLFVEIEPKRPFAGWSDVVRTPAGRPATRRRHPEPRTVFSRPGCLVAGRFGHP